jgi:hypothetical protein
MDGDAVKTKIKMVRVLFQIVNKVAEANANQPLHTAVPWKK